MALRLVGSAPRNRSSTLAADQAPATVPGVAAAEQGFVVLDGPPSVAVSMTPEAARRTGLSLQRAADQAEAALQGGARPHPPDAALPR